MFYKLKISHSKLYEESFRYFKNISTANTIILQLQNVKNTMFTMCGILHYSIDTSECSLMYIGFSVA